MDIDSKLGGGRAESMQRHLHPRRLGVGQKEGWDGG